MARRADVARIQGELIDAFKWGEETRARELVFQLDDEPSGVRAELAAMLNDPYGLARQAAAFGLGELGGAASVSLLEKQFAIEEARGDYDGEAVVEDIVQALGRIDEPDARASLVRRLERLAAGEPESADVSVLARALWRRRHPDLIPAVRQGLEQISLPAPNGLHGLQMLLEKSPEELSAWARDPVVPVAYKTKVLVLFEEELPDMWVSTVPAFIFAAQTSCEQAVREGGDAAYYCERLLTLLMLRRERLLDALPEEVRSEVRALALRLVAARKLNCAVRAAAMLQFVGRPEDAAVIEAHRPAHPDLAKDFDEFAQAVRALQ
ncbi:MAG: hypothetical protein JXB05_27680 [Myxococcaceae bacterium]|nr:hypothetical protein [Myxococcaceae bacterium]